MATSGRGLALADDDRLTLESWARSSSLRAGLVERARIVLAVADGEGTSVVARRLSVSRPTVIKWRERFAAGGLETLTDQARSGRPKRLDDSAIIARTLEPPPGRLGVTHWSTRLLARELGIGDASVARGSARFSVYRMSPRLCPVGS